MLHHLSRPRHLLQKLLLRRRLRQLLPQRRDPLFRLHLSARRLLRLRQFPQHRPPPPLHPPLVRFHRPPPRR